MKRILLTTALSAGLIACGDGNPFDTNNVNNNAADPNTNANKRFLFDTGRFLTANQFTYDATADTIQINNLPFDGVSASGGAYTRQAAVVLPNGAQVYQNSPGTGEDTYVAVIVRNGTTGTLAGAVGTNAYRGFGYGGAYAERPSSGLPATRPAAYSYTGNYAGVRVIRQDVTGAADALQLTTGTAGITVDLQNLDNGGSIKGRVTGRQLWDTNGNLIGAMDTILLNETTIDTTNNRTNDNATADTLNADGTQAQVGTWEGNFSGPNGEEIVGYVVIEGQISDRDPSHDATNTVEGREIGGFITQVTP